jgi:hypothetical protein
MAEMWGRWGALGDSYKHECTGPGAFRRRGWTRRSRCARIGFAGFERILDMSESMIARPVTENITVSESTGVKIQTRTTTTTKVLTAGSVYTIFSWGTNAIAMRVTVQSFSVTYSKYTSSSLAYIYLISTSSTTDTGGTDSVRVQANYDSTSATVPSANWFILKSDTSKDTRTGLRLAVSDTISGCSKPSVTVTVILYFIE